MVCAVLVCGVRLLARACECCSGCCVNALPSACSVAVGAGKWNAQDALRYMCMKKVCTILYCACVRGSCANGVAAAPCVPVLTSAPCWPRRVAWSLAS